MKEAIKAYGNYEVEIKLFQDISAKFIVKVHG
jgi:ribosomal protein L9